MKKEDADQLIRCVKECWWRVAAILMIVNAGVLIAVNGRPEGGWKLDWTAVAAISTLAAAIVALWLGLRQIQQTKSIREHEARVVAAYLAPVLEKIAATLRFFLDDFDVSRHTFGNGLEEKLAGLWAVERISFKEVVAYSSLAPFEASVLGENINSLISMLELKGIPKQVDPEFNYEWAVHSMQLEESGLRFRQLAESLRGLSSNMRDVTYQPQISAMS